MSDARKFRQILDLKDDATLEEIRTAYLKQAKQWHPDRYADDPMLKQQAEEKFKQVTEAYKGLKETFDQQMSSRSSTDQATSRSQVKAKQTDAEWFYDLAGDSAKEGKYEEAIEDLSIAIRLNPKYAKAYLFRGHLNSQLNFELRAEADFAKARGHWGVMGKVQRADRIHLRLPIRVSMGGGAGEGLLESLFTGAFF